MALGYTAKKTRTTPGVLILAVTSTSRGRCVALQGTFQWTSSGLHSTRQILSQTVCDRTPRRAEASSIPAKTSRPRSRLRISSLKSWRDLKSVSQRSRKCRRKSPRCKKISNAAFAPPSENGRGRTTSSSARCLAPLTRIASIQGHAS